MGAALAEERIALVIGNSKYQNTSHLPNPTSDARRMAAALGKIGFTTIGPRLDLSYAELRRELATFNMRANGADMALVFFAGHGMEFGGKTYLVPTDARLHADVDIEWEVVPLDLVLTAAEPSKMQLVILDACRDNPLAAKMNVIRSASRGLRSGAAQNALQPAASLGLAVVEPRGANTLIAYAAKHGSVAYDGDASNSPYTLAILDHIEEPGVELRLLFGKVRDNVVRRTGGKQEPFVYGSIGGRQLYLVPPRAQSASLQPSIDPERKMWSAIQAKGSKELLDLYLQLYPQGQYAGEARRRLAAVNSSTLPPSLPTTAADLVIAVAGPMTGPNAAFGAQMRQAAERAVADLNVVGGVLGRRLRLVVADDRSDPREGVAAAHRLVQEKVAFVAGHFNSGISIPASAVYEDAGIIMISPASSNPALTDRGRRNVFRVIGRDDRQGGVAAQYLVRNLATKRVAIVHDKTNYGKGLADDFRATFNRLGQREVLYQSVGAGEKDMRPLAAEVQRSGAEIVYWGGLHLEAGMLLRQMRASGMQTRLMAGDGLATDEFWRIAGPAAEGTLMTFFPDPRQQLEASRVVKQFRQSKIEPEGFTLHTYAAIQAWAEAARKAGTIAAADVARALVDGRFSTVLGTLGFDAKGDVTLPSFTMWRWSSGRYTQLH